ncbi:bifunctional hydroxymethylpyrimidine kinase/phosphomethylpyrimidine kinase [Thermovenabulum sp.]|uniref:bifunctional hydroxymethylpyrimidine kinase/phosphomethylpyrimidine kinase n=1 Tax=Thermovenabulum sp. TaxID=3100335 RepID=UPI003C7ED72E
MKLALTIAGSDSGGGAGIQADLKTFFSHGVYGMSVITSVTAQNTLGVLGVQNISEDMVYLQMKAVFEDLFPDAVKIGMVSTKEIIEAISEGLEEYKPEKIILDPVMISKSGHRLLEKDAIKTLIEKLVPKALIITPNREEAEVIAERKIKNIEEMKKAAKDIAKLGCRTVLIKGGHLEGNKAIDILYLGEENFVFFEEEKINTKNTHGTGCTFSAAICANLAKGMDIKKAVAYAKLYITRAIKTSGNIGRGWGPVNHFCIRFNN